MERSIVARTLQTPQLARCRDLHRETRMRLRMAGLFISMLVGVLMVLLRVKAVRGFPYLLRHDDYEDVPLALWSSLSPI